MKQKLFINTILLLVVTVMAAACGDANSRYVKKAIRIMDKNGIYAQGPEWEKAKQTALTACPANLEEAQEIVAQAGKVAGGKHTFLMTSDEVVTNDTSEWAMPTVELMENGIAVIKLPRFSGNAEDGIEYANTVLKGLSDDLRGVVIDLRGNSGGNMYPMIAAIHRFLPDDILLKFTSRKKPITINKYYILNSTCIDEQGRIECPVALLTDDWTGSSGEAVMLCFRGLDYSRTFGIPTAGYASANKTYPLPDGSMLVLTIGEDVARTGEVFCDDPIAPDVVSETPLEDAIKWIESYKQ